jgi:hypothetical protein
MTTFNDKKNLGLLGLDLKFEVIFGEIWGFDPTSTIFFMKDKI